MMKIAIQYFPFVKLTTLQDTRLVDMIDEDKRTLIILDDLPHKLPTKKIFSVYVSP